MSGAESTAAVVAPDAQRARRRGRVLLLSLLGVVTLLVIAGLALVTVAPAIDQNDRTVLVQADEAVPIVGSNATVTPGAGWVARPIGRPLIAGVPFLLSPAGLFGETPGVELISPDGALEVQLDPSEVGADPAVQVAAAATAAWGDPAESAGAADPGADSGDAASGDAPDADPAGDAAGWQVRTETLASGVVARHVAQDDDAMIAVLVPAAGATGAETTADADADADADAAGGERVSGIEVRVVLAADAAHEWSAYLPEIGGLLERIRFE